MGAAVRRACYSPMNSRQLLSALGTWYSREPMAYSQKAQISLVGTYESFLGWGGRTKFATQQSVYLQPL
ncbi:hypothetical protein MnTg02_02546 [bacterium MnTg02]|nr:hypothetical protein MnTg02_02546 [bacterium MnTg02]